MHPVSELAPGRVGLPVLFFQLFPEWTGLLGVSRVAEKGPGHRSPVGVARGVGPGSAVLGSSLSYCPETGQHSGGEGMFLCEDLSVSLGALDLCLQVSFSPSTFSFGRPREAQESRACHPLRGRWSPEQHLVGPSVTHLCSPDCRAR